MILMQLLELVEQVHETHDCHKIKFVLRQLMNQKYILITMRILQIFALDPPEKRGFIIFCRAFYAVSAAKAIFAAQVGPNIIFKICYPYLYQSYTGL